MPLIEFLFCYVIFKNIKCMTYDLLMPHSWLVNAPEKCKKCCCWNARNVVSGNAENVVAENAQNDVIVVANEAVHGQVWLLNFKDRFAGKFNNLGTNLIEYVII